MKKKKFAILLSLLTFNSLFFFSCQLKQLNNSTPSPTPSSSSSVDSSVTPTPSISSSPTPSTSSSSSSELKADENERMVFMSNRDGFWEIYTMNTDGTNQTKLTSDEMKSAFPFSISPNGKKLAYISDKSGSKELWVMDLESKEKTQLTDTELVEEGTPSWFSDGSKIAFHANFSKKEKFEILEIPYPLTNKITDTTLITSDSELKKRISSNDFDVLHPAYSPDGTCILYSMADSEGNTALYVYDDLQKKSTRLTKITDNAISGYWTPNSRKIIYWTLSDGIFSINKDGTGSTEIGTIKNAKGTPIVSPDGSRMLISRGNGTPENYNVWIMDITGRNLKVLTTLGGISLGWYNVNGIKPTPSPSGNASSTPIPQSTSSIDPNTVEAVDPNDPLINP